MNLKKIIKQFAEYIIVGGIATIVEWSFFYILNESYGIYYITATIIAFIISTFANWIAGKLILFHEWKNILKELFEIYITSIAGLIFNLVIMWISVEVFGVMEIISKIIATGIVFLWNFLIRKLVIYKI